MSKYFSISLLAFLLMVVPSAYSQSKPDSLQLDSLDRKHKKTMRKEDGTLDAIGRYTPQSPQTASLLKYTEFPVSPATGIPNIDIPIYTIEWDGTEQAMISQKNMNKPSANGIMFKMNTMWWSISDLNYKSWKNAINSKFGAGTFTVPQTKRAIINYGGMRNIGKIRLQSVAQYGLTIFWRELKWKNMFL